MRARAGFLRPWPALVLLAACGDRSPPALWPEPPPPTLAKPIGIDEPVRESADPGTTTADPGAAGEPASADEPYPPGEQAPPERLPMPLLTP